MNYPTLLTFALSNCAGPDALEVLARRRLLLRPLPLRLRRKPVRSGRPLGTKDEQRIQPGSQLSIFTQI